MLIFCTLCSIFSNNKKINKNLTISTSTIIWHTQYIIMSLLPWALSRLVLSKARPSTGLVFDNGLGCVDSILVLVMMTVVEINLVLVESISVLILVFQHSCSLAMFFSKYINKDKIWYMYRFIYNNRKRMYFIYKLYINRRHYKTLHCIFIL